MIDPTLEYLAEKKALPNWTAGAVPQQPTKPAKNLPVALSDRILAWWLKRSTWRNLSHLAP